MTAYMIHCRARGGNAYEWSDRAITQELGQKTVKEGVPVTRRVLSIPSDRACITVEPD